MSLFSCSYKLAGTNTFRLSSAALLGRWGSNSQNIKRENRSIIIARPGYRLCQRDQAGAEAKIVAYECPRGNFQLMFELGIKPHTRLAMRIFARKFDCEDLVRLPLEDLAAHPKWKEKSKEIAKTKREYPIGKMTRHAMSYGEGPNTLRYSCLEQSGGTLVISAAESKLFLEEAVQDTPEIVDYQQEIQLRLKNERTLRNLFGFPREFFQRYTDQLLRQALAFIPQSTVGCITNIAFTRLQSYIEQNDLAWNLLANTHDSILCECPIGQEDHCLEALKFLEMALTSTRGYKYKMGTEASVGFNWGKKSPDNPRGMEEVKG